MIVRPSTAWLIVAAALTCIAHAAAPVSPPDRDPAWAEAYKKPPMNAAEPRPGRSAGSLHDSDRRAPLLRQVHRPRLTLGEGLVNPFPMVIRKEVRRARWQGSRRPITKAALAGTFHPTPFGPSGPPRPVQAHNGPRRPSFA